MDRTGRFYGRAAKKWFRLAPGAMVRLKSAYIVKCEGFIKDEAGKITEIHCTYIPESKSGNDTAGINVKGTIHWVSAAHAINAEVGLYDRLFKVENPSAGRMISKITSILIPCRSFRKPLWSLHWLIHDRAKVTSLSGRDIFAWITNCRFPENQSLTGRSH